MAVQITKQRRARLVRTNTRTEEPEWQMRAQHFTPPEGAIACGDGVFCRVTILPDREVYETWIVEAVTVH